MEKTKLSIGFSFGDWQVVNLFPRYYLVDRDGAVGVPIRTCLIFQGIHLLVHMLVDNPGGRVGYVAIWINLNL